VTNIHAFTHTTAYIHTTLTLVHTCLLIDVHGGIKHKRCASALASNAMRILWLWLKSACQEAGCVLCCSVAAQGWCWCCCRRCAGCPFKLSGGGRPGSGITTAGRLQKDAVHNFL